MKILRSLEELPDCFPSFELSQGAAFPNGVLYEQLGYFVRVVVIVAVCCVRWFQVSDGVCVLQNADLILKLFIRSVV